MADEIVGRYSRIWGCHFENSGRLNDSNVLDTSLLLFDQSRGKTITEFSFVWNGENIGSFTSNSGTSILIMQCVQLYQSILREKQSFLRQNKIYSI